MADEINARTFGRNLSISTKQAVEICNWIRGKNVQKAKNMLESVIGMKTAVPFRRFNKDMGHKKGKIAAGRYPLKSSKHILDILKSAEINAQAKGMNAQGLFIKKIIANKGSKVLRYGRKRRISAKRTHVEVILSEKEKKETKKEEIKENKKK